VRPLKFRAFQLDDRGHAVRKNADTLVGLPYKSPYRASGTIRGDWKYRRDSNDTQILSAKGFQLDIITDFEDAAVAGAIPKSWLGYKRSDAVQSTSTHLNGMHHSEDQVTSQFWRTMVAGKGPNGQNPPLSYPLVVQELFEDAYDINLGERRNLTKNEVLRDFIDRVRAVVWGRRLCRTSKHKRLALLPGETKLNDRICIIYGYSVPVVLRKLKTKTAEGDPIWELIGECYMYEMMAGEALVVRQVGSKVDRKFYRFRQFEIR